MFCLYFRYSALFLGLQPVLGLAAVHGPSTERQVKDENTAAGDTKKRDPKIPQVGGGCSEVTGACFQSDAGRKSLMEESGRLQ